MNRSCSYDRTRYRELEQSLWKRVDAGNVGDAGLR